VNEDAIERMMVENERRTFHNFVSARRNYLSLSQTYWLAVDRESGDADL
jgi:hypothetical protein